MELLMPHRAMAALLCAVAVAGCTVAPSEAPSSTLPEGLPPFQREILSDGVVTFAEYERAVFRTVQCLRELGYEVDGPELGARGLFYDYWVTVGPEGSAATSEAQDRCDEEYLRSVAFAWARQNELTGAELEAELERLRACLGEAGVEVAADATVEDLIELVDGVDDEAFGCYLESPVFAR